ncbi:MAG: Rpn family recombination-promoting nuclease/putative transposase [Algicola sp.]|nr:Rpn family recombination-promoting nuclease/putative transposase [Algicola sp.]
MEHPIDATNDYAFARLFAVEQNTPLLVDFLNCTLNPDKPILSVTLLNPFDEREFETDKLCVVDVLARDQQGLVYQVEIQTTSNTHLRNRMLYNWSCLYKKQLEKGKFFDKLRPVYAIWILTENLIHDSSDFQHEFGIADLQRQVKLTDHMQIHMLELKKWAKQTHSLPQHRWLHFFNDSKGWLSLPDNLNTPIMRQAMNILEEISDKEDNYYRYMAIEEATIERATVERQKEDAEAALKLTKAKLQAQEEQTNQLKSQAQAQKVQVQEKEAQVQEQQTRADLAQKEVENLKRLLHEAGINPKG